MIFDKKKWRCFLIFVFFIIVSSAFATYNNLNDKDIVKDKEEIKVDKKQFGMYVENEDGEFVEYTDSELFPDSSMYTFNEEKSFCVDNKDNVLENIISYSNGKVTVTSNKTLYCTLYFDGDSIPPVIDVNVIDNYYTSARLSILSNEDGTYCVNKSNTIGDISNCINEGGLTKDNTIITSNFLESGIYYVHIKDKKGNEIISDSLDIKVLYQKVEYIEATGTQYIDTAVSAPEGFKTIAKFNPVASHDNYLIGSHNLSAPYGRNGFGILRNVWEMGLGDTCPSTTNEVQYGIDYDVEASTIKGNSYLKLNNNVIISSSDTSTRSSSNILIFQMQWHLNINVDGFIGKLYYLKLYDNLDNLVRYFIPVYRITDNVIGLFDEVNKSFYTNVGTGVFEKGDNIDIGVPVVTASVVDNNTESPKILITSNEIGTYCVNTSSVITNFSNCVLTGSVSSNVGVTTSVLSSSGTYYVHVKDDVGNIGISNEVVIKVRKSGTLFGDILLDNPPTGFNSTIQSGLYRYQGTNVDNYICFGTSDKDTCLSNTDVYMYRIIGIASDGRIKVMKNYALNTEYYWHNTNLNNITWPNSDLYKGLNGISGGKYSNLFIGNNSYMPSGWIDKIENTIWKYGDNTNVNVTAEELYNIENAWTDTVDAKIGLIYMHDYYYAYQSGGLNCSSSGSICKTSWMFISVCDSGAPGVYESSMSRGDYYSDDTYRVWYVSPFGNFHRTFLDSTASVRPVFFLTSSVNYVSGSGKSDDPFIIS